MIKWDIDKDSDHWTFILNHVWARIQWPFLHIVIFMYHNINIRYTCIYCSLLIRDWKKHMRGTTSWRWLIKKRHFLFDGVSGWQGWFKLSVLAQTNHADLITNCIFKITFYVDSFHLGAVFCIYVKCLTCKEICREYVGQRWISCHLWELSVQLCYSSYTGQQIISTNKQRYVSRDFA